MLIDIVHIYVQIIQLSAKDYLCQPCSLRLTFARRQKWIGGHILFDIGIYHHC